MPEPTFSDTLPPGLLPEPSTAEVSAPAPDFATAPTPVTAPVPPGTASAETTSLDVSEEHSVADLYRAAVGPVNTDYYLRVFTRFEAAGRAGASWNWAACLCTLNWMLFRQLWGGAIAYGATVAGAVFLAWGATRLVFQAQDAQQWLPALALFAAACVIPGTWGNAWLYARCRQRLDRALATTATVPEAMLLLNRQASSRQGLAWLALANAVLAGAALGLWIAFPHGVPSNAAASASASASAVVSAPLPAAAAPASAPAAPASVAAVASESLAAASAPASTPSAPDAASAAKSEVVVQAASSLPVPRLSPSAPTMVAAGSASPGSAPVAAPSPVASSPNSASRLAASAASRPVQSAASPASRAASPASTSAGRGYYINVGLFAQESNARNARDKLKAAGMAVFTEDLQSKSGDKRTRVRVGPFDTRADADAAVEKIRALGLEALVFKQ